MAGAAAVGAGAATPPKENPAAAAGAGAFVPAAGAGAAPPPKLKPPAAGAAARAPPGAAGDPKLNPPAAGAGAGAAAGVPPNEKPIVGPRLRDLVSSLDMCELRDMFGVWCLGFEDGGLTGVRVIGGVGLAD